MMVAVAVPSRGLVYSKTMQSVIDGMQALSKVGIASLYVSSHDLPIPDSHNYCVETALQNPAVDKVLFIEEDMFVYPDAFVSLCTSESDMTTLQYNDKNGSPHGIIHYNEAGEVLWSGLGATVVKRPVFEALGVPYFRTDVRYKIVKKKIIDGKAITEYEEQEARSQWGYGGLDVDFFTRARQKGFSVKVLPEYKAHHFALVALGPEADNNGCHIIRQV
jgi:hypothetical protein